MSFTNDINVGNLLSLGVFLVALITMHRQNTDKLREAAERLASIETKLEILYEWWINGGPD